MSVHQDREERSRQSKSPLYVQLGECLRVYIAVIKHHYQEQPGEERVYSTFEHVVQLPCKLEQESRDRN